MTGMGSDNPWSEYRRLVLDKFDVITARLEKGDVKMDELKDSLMDKITEAKTDIITAESEWAKTLADSRAHLESEIDAVKTDVTILKVKAAAIGAICGAVPAIISLAIQMFGG